MKIENLKKKVAVGFATATMSALAFAQADTADQGVQAITELSTKATAYIGASFSVAVLVAGGFWGISMMKKAFHKGS